MSIEQRVLTVEEETKRRYKLVPNDLYTYPADRTVKAISTCPTVSEIKIVKSEKSGGGEFTFNTNLSRTQFLSNVIKVCYKLPFNIKLKAWPQVDDGAGNMVDAVIDSDNFMKLFLNNNSDICLAHHALSQAEEYSVLSFNSKSLGNVTEIPALTNITSPYWATDQVNEYLQASQPDRFQSFQQYNGGLQTLKFINTEDAVTYTTVSPENEQNIFASKYAAGYNTRTPQFSFVSVDKAALTIKVTALFWKYVQFSVGATPNNEASFAGLERLEYVSRLKGDLGSRVFNIKKVGTPLASRYESIISDISDSENTDAWLVLKVITPPEYMSRTMRFPNGKLKPYTIGVPKIDCKLFTKQTVAPGAGADFNVGGITLGSVPRSIYVGLMKVRQDKVGDNASTIINTPINFGLITQLTVTFDSVNTVFSNQKALTYVTDSNGYDILDVLGKQCAGYPVKLNFGKDITLPSTLIVGASGSYNLSITGKFMNQGSETSDYQLYVVTVGDATLDFDGDSFSQTNGVYIPSELLSTEYFLRDLYSDTLKELEIVGAGRFGDAVKWLGSRIFGLAKGAWENRDKIASTIGDVSQLVKAVRGGKVAMHNVSGAGSDATTITLGAGSVKKKIFG